ncbi:MAG: HD domain-containing protein [Deltaproteobacteria bacterium]|nr:HD domain-containing protein [Deltaproteobacteria bacterium]
MGGRVDARETQEALFKFYKIPVGLYHPGDLIEEDLYFLYQGNYLLYRLKNLSWKSEDRSKLEDFGVQDLYIKCSSDRSHHYFLETHLNRILDEPDISIKDKANILYSTAVSVVKEVFDKPDQPENLRRSMATVKHSIDYLSRDKEHFFELMSLARSDFSEYTHAIHVSAYAITLAKQVGIKTFNHISALGIAAILHDIGKMKVDPKIVAKSGSLTNEERREMEKHPQYSYELVHRLGTIPELSETIILQHHERPDGAGYPKGLVENEIHALSKIISLCDCFDSMTSERSYQKSLTPLQAIECLRTEYQNQYDQNLIVEFIRMLKR